MGVWPSQAYMLWIASLTEEELKAHMRGEFPRTDEKPPETEEQRTERWFPIEDLKG